MLRGGGGVVGRQTAADNHLTFSDWLTGVIFSVAMVAGCKRMTRCTTKVVDGWYAKSVVFGVCQPLNHGSRDSVPG